MVAQDTAWQDLRQALDELALLHVLPKLRRRQPNASNGCPQCKANVAVGPTYRLRGPSKDGGIFCDMKAVPSFGCPLLTLCLPVCDGFTVVEPTKLSFREGS